ncbi:MAG: ATP-dependent DNA helicase [Thermoprotei archaeon]
MPVNIRYFPYKPRKGQLEFMDFLQEGLRNSNVIINAVTGFGKTPLILASVIPEALKKGKRIIWIVRTGNETDRPIEELKQINMKIKNEKIRGLSLRGKKDMCLLIRDMNIEELDYDDVGYICKINRDKCKYYVSLHNFDFNVHSFENSAMLYSEILDYCKRFNICPYYFQYELLSMSLVISLSYNYILNEDISWALRNYISFKDTILVIDEAHNLQFAASSINSNRISLNGLKKAIDEIHNFEDYDKEKTFLKKMYDYLLKLSKEIIEEEEFNIKECIEYCANDIKNFINIITRIKALGNKIRKTMLDQGKRPTSSLYHLGTFWEEALKNLNKDGIAFLITTEKDNIIIEMWDMRAKEILEKIWNNFYRCVFCSGTLKPIDSFADIIGLENYIGKEFPSIFTDKNCITLITKKLTTKGEELSEEMAQKYLEIIEEFTNIINENIGIFSASYRIQEDLLKIGLKEKLERMNRNVFIEEQGMSGIKARETLDEFKKCAYKEKKGVLIATMTGRFAEGADFPGKELEGIFLVGIPFDKITIRTKLYIDYYKKIYGKEKGEFYAYILPAIRRASQTLGRALRSEEDRAIFILGDKRYIKYIDLLPDFIKNNYKIINKKEDIKENIKTFLTN